MRGASKMSMGKKVLWLVALWAAVVVAYVFLAAAMPAIRDLSSQAVVDMNASANMSQQPGAVGAVETAPIWVWFIPGTIGGVFSVIILSKKG